ncbi:manganese efflux pump MntP [Lachnospiraceae bacterium LCP25S3_G4]
MNIIELFIIAVGLSMDAFAVSICKGLAMKRCTWKKACIVGLYFGVFQAGMPLIGYALGSQFKTIITSIDHWIAFILLSIIGLNMIKEARTVGCDECETKEEALDIKTMLGLAVATSIDALAVGVTFAFLEVQIVPAVSFIGIITFTLSVAGVKIGHVFGTQYKTKAEWAGGIILLLMGFKILLEHLGMF